MNYDGLDVAAIESALDAHSPDGWRRARSEELRDYRALDLRAAWRLEMPPGRLACPGVNFLIAGIDAVFPASQPRVIAPQADRNFSWPHVERGGVLCLTSTRPGAGAGERVIQHIAWACDLLNYTEEQRRAEFKREFAAYWDQRSSAKPPSPAIYSLVAPRGPLREIACFADWAHNEIVVADERETLLRWLRNTGRNPGDKQTSRSALVWLDNAPMPSEFPETGRDVLRLLPDELAARVLRAGERVPVILGAATPTGPALAGVVLQSASAKALSRGFRSLDRVPPARITEVAASRPVRRHPVTRVDGPWVHGRDHNETYSLLASKAAAFVGCGSLGASIAKILAQAGVGGFVLIDPDRLLPHNTARHVLGHRFAGQFKAKALERMLAEDFPAIRSVVGFSQRFEALPAHDLAKLSAADLVISAGVDLATELRIDKWRKEAGGRCAHLSAWVEEFGIVGHAVAIFGDDSLASGFDCDGYPHFQLTDWPDDAKTVIVEAGCGNVFQPHGAADLQMTIGMASRLALDVLGGWVTKSVRRVWQGDRAQVAARGGRARESFARDNSVQEFEWT